MRSNRYFLLLVCFIFAGCAAPIKMSHPLAENSDAYNALIIRPLENEVVGEISEDVCNKVMLIAAHGLVKRQLFPFYHVDLGLVGVEGERAERVASASIPLDSLDQMATKAAELQISLLEYKKGNSFLRFLFGTWAGSGYVLMEIKMIDHVDQHLLMAGTTKAMIQGAYAKEENVINPLAKAIIKFVEKKFLG